MIFFKLYIYDDDDFFFFENDDDDDDDLVIYNNFMWVRQFWKLGVKYRLI